MTVTGPLDAKTQGTIDERNRRFWDELCGTHLARSLGVVDASPRSLRRFDDWYFALYPYLFREIPFAALAGRRVLEVGLGYGTVGQRIAQSGARYVGLDIATGPVAMLRHRLLQIGNDGQAVQGSVLACPFRDEAFDAVVAIGSYHHTGDLQRALDETWRVLTPGGTAYVMVYSAYSYRRLMSAPASAGRHLLWDKLGVGAPPGARERERARYDSSPTGGAAPHTDFVSVSQLRRICWRWSDVRARRENIGAEGPLRYLPRPTALRLFGCWLGLDLYCNLRK